MCILLEFDCAKFGVSNLFCSKVIEEKPLGGRLDPLGKGSVNTWYLLGNYDTGPHVIYLN